MAKKLKETDIHTYRLPLVVLSAALQQKIGEFWIRVFRLKPDPRFFRFLIRPKKIRFRTRKTGLTTATQIASRRYQEIKLWRTSIKRILRIIICKWQVLEATTAWISPRFLRPTHLKTMWHWITVELRLRTRVFSRIRINIFSSNPDPD